MAQKLPTGIVSHARKVCSLYKRALRNTEAWYPFRDEFRYQAVLLRDRFDRNANIKDMRVAKKILLEGEEELHREWHVQQKIFAESPGGVAYGRVATIPDWVLDYWDPIEKAQYPKYFATREKRKKEYEEFYRKEYIEKNQTAK